MHAYIVSWECRDIDRCEILAHGKTGTENPGDVLIRIPWTPYFQIEVPKRNQTEMGARAFAMTLYDSVQGLVKPLCRVIKKKPFVGFRNGKQHYFVQLVFESLAMWRRAKYNSKHTLYEAALDPLIKFFHVSGVPAAGWVSITGAYTEITDEETKISKPHVTELKIDSYRGIERGPESLDNETPPLVICSWDIEAFSDSGAFPDSSKPSDKVITIGAVYARFGDPIPFAQSVHVLGTANPIDGVDVYTYEREEDLITGFMMETVRRRTDLLLAWNSYGFDHSYIDGRAVTLIDDQTGKSLLDMTVWSKTKDPEAGKLLEKQLASSAYGDNTYRYHNTPGIVSVDALQIFRKETKHDSYTLDNIAKHYLDISKIDLKPWEMFAKFRESDPTGRTEIAEYCVRDCLLPIQLVHKMNMLNGLIEFSKVTHVPIDWLLLRGQQIRVYSLICKAARDKGFLVPDMHSSGDDLGFTGAVVLDPKSGGYTEDIVCAMDFASLYPSIMMAHNMCGSTLVTDPQYAHCTGVDYYEIEAAPGVKVRFAQTKDNVIPGLLYELKALRKQAKLDMATAKNDFTKGLLNSRQLAYKLVMNSLYGALGSNHGLLCGLKKISMSVTATGRYMIYETKRLVETLNPGSKVVYGDSVAEWTPITIRTSTGIDIVTFEDLAARVTWVPRGDGKEVAYHGLDIWSDKGWTSIRAIIRHQHTDPLVRVATHTGVVDVTAHHSLLRPNGEMVKPTDLSIGDDLMHADGPHIPQETLESLATQKITGHLAAARVFRALRAAGYTVTITSCTGDTYTVSTRSMDDKTTCIQSMREIPYTGYVYDVTTDNHHFAAGVGDLVVHNTDSVLCILNCGEEHRQDLNEHFRVAEDLADKITKHFLPPHELEMEKAYFPYLLITKKRYAGLMYERPDGTPKIDIKGLQLVRRDSPKIVKRISYGMLEILLHERSFEKALVYVQNQILDMLQDRVPFEEYVMSKSLRSNYKNTNLPHLVVSRKRVSRGGEAFHSGERVPFVYARSETDMDLGISQRAEDAEYARDNNIPIDTLYYIKNQVLTPLVTLLQLHYKHAEGEILNHAEIASHMVRLEALTSRLVQKSKRIRTNTSNNQREITSFFKRDP